MFFGILFLIFILILFKDDAMFSKQNLINAYRKTRPTFGKWMRYCVHGVNLKSYFKRRKLTGSEVLNIIDSFGWPNEYKSCSKGDFVNETGLTYACVRNVVDRNPKNFGLTPQGYLNMDVFPPRQSYLIMRKLRADYMD